MKHQSQLLQPSRNQLTVGNYSEDDQDIDDNQLDQERMMTDQDFDGQQEY